MAADVEGRLHMLWQRYSGGGRLTYSIYEAGAWSQMEDALSGGLGFHDLKVLVSSDGSEVHLAASMIFSAGRVSFWHFRRGADGWRAEFQHPMQGIPISRIGATLDTDGSVHVVFDFDERVHYATNRGGRWQISRLLDNTRIDASLDLAMDRFGRMTVLYRDLDAAQMGVMRGRFSGIIEPQSVERGEVF